MYPVIELNHNNRNHYITIDLADAEFIAAARTDLPDALDKIEELQKDLSSLERFRALRTKHNDELQLRTTQLVQAARKIEGLRTYVDSLESRCGRYKRERDDDRIDYAKTYQQRDELLRRVEELEKS